MASKSAGPVLRCLCLLNDLVHLPVVEYLVNFGFWCTQLLLAPFYLSCYLLLGVADVLRGYVWWRYEEADPNKPIVVTGCDTGFGHSLTLDLVARGWKVYACCLTEAGMASLKEKCQGKGELVTLKLDVSKEEEIKAVAQRVQQECPNGVYALVNNAGRRGSGLEYCRKG